MKKVIPFEKELIFKTKICEVTSISLEHTLTMPNNDEVNGEFIISGDYKMNEGSINREPFEFTIPFDIVLDCRYDTTNIKLDVEDFYYEVINDEKLKVNIEFFIEGIELIKEESTSLEEPREIIEDVIDTENLEIDNINEEESNITNIKLEETNNINENRLNSIIDEEEENEMENINNININNESKENNNNTNVNIFNTLDNTETYVSYHVYIVKEEDNIDSIMKKYNITKEELENYNNIDEIKVGDKIIIPYVKTE